MSEPDWLKVDEAARALYAHDSSADIDEDVWENDVTETERQDYRNEAARIAIVANIMRKEG